MAGPYVNFVYGDPKISGAMISLVVAVLIGFSMSGGGGGGGGVSNYGWCG